MNNNVVSL